MSRKEVARYLKISPGTLAVWDSTKRYDLQPIKVGAAVRYRRTVIEEFLHRRPER